MSLPIIQLRDRIFSIVLQVSLPKDTEGSLTMEEAVDRLLELFPSKEQGNNFEHDLQHLINYYSKENESDTPDFILMAYLVDCLQVWGRATNWRDALKNGTTTTDLGSLPGTNSNHE